MPVFVINYSLLVGKALHFQSFLKWPQNSNFRSCQPRVKLLVCFYLQLLKMSDTMQYFSIYEKEFERELHNINQKLSNESKPLPVNQQKSFVVDLEGAFNETQVTVIYG